MFKKSLIIGGLVSSFALLFALAPRIAKADAVSDLQAQISAVMAQIQSLQSQINTIQGTPGGSQSDTASATPATNSSSANGFCYNFTRYLAAGINLRSADANALQQVLVNEGLWDSGTALTSFDDNVAAAVVQLQGQYGITQTGTVGPKTRAKLNQLYGCNTATSIVSVTGSPTLVLNYDSAGGEAQLTATFNVSVTAGAQAVQMPQRSAGIQIADQNGKSGDTNSYSQTLTPTSSNISNVDSGYGSYNYVIQPGQTGTFVASASMNPKQMFAGTYHASLVSLGIDGRGSGIISVFGNPTNVQTIIGEVSPYISSVTNPATVGQTFTISGARLNNNQVFINNSLVSNATIDSAPDGSSLRFTLPSVSAGAASVYVVNRDLGSTAGKSNTVWVQINSATVAPGAIQPSITVPSPDGVTVQNGYSASGGTVAVLLQYILRGFPYPRQGLSDYYLLKDGVALGKINSSSGAVGASSDATTDWLPGLYSWPTPLSYIDSNGITQAVSNASGYKIRVTIKDLLGNLIASGTTVNPFSVVSPSTPAQSQPSIDWVTVPNGQMPIKQAPVESGLPLPLMLIQSSVKNPTVAGRVDFWLMQNGTELGQISSQSFSTSSLSFLPFLVSWSTPYSYTDNAGNKANIAVGSGYKAKAKLYVGGTLVSTVISDNTFSMVDPSASSVQPIPTISVSPDAATPSSSSLTPGQSNVALSIIDLRATGGSVLVNQISVGVSPISAGSSVRNIGIYDGSTLLGTIPSLGNSNSGQNNQWGSVNIQTLTVPADTTKTLTLRADISPSASGSFSMGIVGLAYPVSTPYQSGSWSGFGSTMTVSASAQVQPSITVLSPNGGEVWRVGDTKRISWQSSGLKQVKIYIVGKGNDGYTNLTYLNNNLPLPATNGYFDWTITALDIPARAGTFSSLTQSQILDNYQIRIDESDGLRSDGTPVVQVFSQSFTVGLSSSAQPSITSLFSDYPSYVATNNASFSWSRTGDFSAADRFYFVYLKPTTAQVLVSGKGGQITYTPIYFRVSSLAYPKFAAVFPSDVTPGTYYLEVDYADSNGNPLASATSNSFTVTAPTSSIQPSITVLSPNGGESWQAGSSQTIRWSSSSVNKVSIWLCQNNVCNRFVEIPATGVVNNNSYTVVIPSSASGSSKIRVASEDSYPTSTLYDDSDSYFTISAPTTTTSKPLACGSIGDVNGDGVISQSDIDVIRASILGNSAPLTDAQKKAADVNGDGTVSTLDITYINSYLVGTQATFPGCASAAQPSITITSTSAFPTDSRGTAITNLYTTLLNRQPDSAGFYYFYNSTLTIDQISAVIKGSVEYLNLHPTPTATTTVLRLNNTEQMASALSAAKDILEKILNSLHQ